MIRMFILKNIVSEGSLNKGKAREHRWFNSHKVKPSFLTKQMGEYTIFYKTINTSKKFKINRQHASKFK